MFFQKKLIHIIMIGMIVSWGEAAAMEDDLDTKIIPSPTFNTTQPTIFLDNPSSLPPIPKTSKQGFVASCLNCQIGFWRISSGLSDIIGTLSSFASGALTILLTQGNLPSATQQRLGFATSVISYLAPGLKTFKVISQKAIQDDQAILKEVIVENESHPILKNKKMFIGVHGYKAPSGESCIDGYFRCQIGFWKISQGWFDGIGVISGFTGAILTTLATNGIFSTAVKSQLGIAGAVLTQIPAAMIILKEFSLKAINDDQQMLSNNGARN